MPAVAAGRVLVTGVNGYIGIWVARVLLERGYAVRGTVRSEGKAQHIRQLFKPFAERFEMVVVPDITKVSPFVSSFSALLSWCTTGRSIRRSREGRRRGRASRIAVPLPRHQARW